MLDLDSAAPRPAGESALYYGLKQTTRLRRETPCVVLFSAADTAVLRFLHPLYGVLLALCDGQRTCHDLVAILADALGLAPERAQREVAQALESFADFLVVSPAPFESPRRYDPLRFVYRPEGPPELPRLSGPVSIAWLVTQRCPFDCVYCCIDTRPTSAGPQDELSAEEARRFVEQCVEIGVEALLFHGGEPLLRPDVPELAGHLLRHGVHVSLSTKLALSPKLVARLAAAGVEELQVSLDSPRADEADDIVGRARFFEGALRNIALLLEHGIRPRSNTVVTSRNVAEIPALLRTLAAHGVRKMHLSGYLRSFRKHDDGLFPGREALRRMAAEVEALRGELGGVEIELCPLDDPRDASLALPTPSACSGGRSGLVVGSDGRVGLCDRMLAFEEAVVGTVRQQTLLEIWNGDRLRAFVDPPPEAFAGTECEGCGLMQTCNRRLRCSYRSWMVDRRLYGPDYLCPVVAAPQQRFF